MMTDLLLPLPATFPAEAVRLLIAKLTGSGLSAKTARQAALTLLAWGLSLLDGVSEPEPHAPVAASAIPADDAALATALQCHLNDATMPVSTTGAGDPATASVPWVVILPLVADLLKRWLDRK